LMPGGLGFSTQNAELDSTVFDPELRPKGAHFEGRPKGARRRQNRLTYNKKMEF